MATLSPDLHALLGLVLPAPPAAAIPPVPLHPAATQALLARRAVQASTRPGPPPLQPPAGIAPLIAAHAIRAAAPPPPPAPVQLPHAVQPQQSAIAPAAHSPAPAPEASWLHTLNPLAHVPLLSHIPWHTVGHEALEGLEGAGIMEGTLLDPAAMEMMPGTPEHRAVERLEAENTARNADLHQTAEAEDAWRQAQAYRLMHPVPRAERLYAVEGAGGEPEFLPADAAVGQKPFVRPPAPQHVTHHYETVLGSVGKQQNVAALLDTATGKLTDLNGEPLPPGFTLAPKTSEDNDYAAVQALVRAWNWAAENDPSLIPGIETKLNAVFAKLGDAIGVTGEGGASPLITHIRVPPGTAQNTSGQNIGTRSVEFPTGETRTRAASAWVALQKIPEVSRDITELRSSGRLGPISGRLRQFLTGGLGLSGPDYVQFRADAQALARTLAAATGESDAEVEKQIEKLLSPKQSPANLFGALRSMQDTLLDVIRRGSGFAERGSAAEATKSPNTANHSATQYAFRGSHWIESTDGGRTWHPYQR